MRVCACCLAAIAVALLATTPSGATPTFQLTFTDPGGTYSAYGPNLLSHAQAALAEWSKHMTGTGSIQLEIRVSSELTLSTGRSLTSSFVGSQTYFGNGLNYNVFDQGIAGEMRTGIDPNGSAFDGELVINPNYLANTLWFDPDPVARTATVPNNRTDAMSVFLHEFGHAFAFNGWRSAFNGTIPAGQNFLSTFDMLIARNAGNGELTFVGDTAEHLYGGPVPITGHATNTYHHLGNNNPFPGADLIPDLMNGVVFFHGTRYYISALDLAILKDTGMAIVQQGLIEGDANGDFYVDIFDVGVISDNWMTAGPAGDVNDDGVVDIFDVGYVSDRWDGEEGAAVPEPSTLALIHSGLLAGAAWVVARRKRGTRR